MRLSFDNRPERQLASVYFFFLPSFSWCHQLMFLLLESFLESYWLMGGNPSLPSTNNRRLLPTLLYDNTLCAFIYTRGLSSKGRIMLGENFPVCTLSRSFCWAYKSDVWTAWVHDWRHSLSSYPNFSNFDLDIQYNQSSLASLPLALWIGREELYRGIISSQQLYAIIKTDDVDLYNDIIPLENITRLFRPISYFHQQPSDNPEDIRKGRNECIARWHAPSSFQTSNPPEELHPLWTKVMV